MAINLYAALDKIGRWTGWWLPMAERSPCFHCGNIDAPHGTVDASMCDDCLSMCMDKGAEDVIADDGRM